MRRDRAPAPATADADNQDIEVAPQHHPLLSDLEWRNLGFDSEVANALAECGASRADLAADPPLTAGEVLTSLLGRHCSRSEDAVIEAGGQLDHRPSAPWPWPSLGTRSGPSSAPCRTSSCTSCTGCSTQGAHRRARAWMGDPYGWHGGHMVQLFANGTHEVVFDDGDRSSAVRHVRTIIPCRHACSALRCSSKARGSNPVA